LGLAVLSEHYLGRAGAIHTYAVELDKDVEPPKEMRLSGLRGLYGLLDEEMFWLAARAVQIVAWDRTHQFCGQCGQRTIPHERDRARVCPVCGLQSFPRLSPAIIVLVERGRQLLLARSARFPKGRYSVIAGFVEPGETLEEAVARELQEEVSIAVENIHYFGSQPWPFPNSLMLGFTADYAHGEICIDDDEIEEAGWFSPDNLPDLPEGISISRKLIDWFLDKQKS
jgi:NAD+ diphosphatase